MCASDMCQAAAEKLLEELGWERDSIDVLLFESVTGDYRTPPTSLYIARQISVVGELFLYGYPYGMLWMHVCNNGCWQFVDNW